MQQSGYEDQMYDNQLRNRPVHLSQFPFFSLSKTKFLHCKDWKLQVGILYNIKVIYSTF